MTDKMTTTERLRQLLDERGVEWKALSGHQMGEFTITATQWHDREGGLLTMCVSEPNGSTWDFFWLPTPEQAVESTLGSRDELDEATMTVLHGRLNAAMLALERANEDAEARINAVSDAHEVLTAAEEMRRGTCHMRLVYEEEDADGFIWPDHYECDACGANVNGIMPSYDTEIQPRFCPNCGRKVVE